MSSVQWQITSASPGTWNVLGLRVEDTSSAEAAWPAFFTGMPAQWYPRMIEAAIGEVGAGSDAVGVIFPGDLDALDLMERPPIPPDSVEIYCHSFASVMLPRATFYAVLLALGEQLLERPGQPGDWYPALRTALQNLRAKISRDRPA